MKCGTIKETVRKEKTPCVIVMISCISKAGILTTTVSVVSYQYCISLHFCLQANKPKSHCLCLLLNVKSAEFSTGETFPCRNKYHKAWSSFSTITVQSMEDLPTTFQWRREWKWLWAPLSQPFATKQKFSLRYFGERKSLFFFRKSHVPSSCILVNSGTKGITFYFRAYVTFFEIVKYIVFLEYDIFLSYNVAAY